MAENKKPDYLVGDIKKLTPSLANRFLGVPELNDRYIRLRERITQTYYVLTNNMPKLENSFGDYETAEMIVSKYKIPFGVAIDLLHQNNRNMSKNRDEHRDNRDIPFYLNMMQ